MHEWTIQRCDRGGVGNRKEGTVLTRCIVELATTRVTQVERLSEEPNEMDLRSRFSQPQGAPRVEEAWHHT